MTDPDDIYSTGPDDNAGEYLEEVSAPLVAHEARVPYEASGVDTALRRYIAIQREMKKLEDERQGLRDIIASHMRAQQKTIWNTTLDGADVGVKCFSQTVVTYDEPLLRERLGSRYTEILDVDIRKVKEHLPAAATLLKPLLDVIGTPSREKVRDAIEQGYMDFHLFDGAFTKTETQRFAVSPSKKRNVPMSNQNTI